MNWKTVEDLNKEVSSELLAWIDEKSSSENCELPEECCGGHGG